MAQYHIVVLYKISEPIHSPINFRENYKTCATESMTKKSINLSKTPGFLTFSWFIDTTF